MQAVWILIKSNKMAYWNRSMMNATQGDQNQVMKGVLLIGTDANNYGYMADVATYRVCSAPSTIFCILLF